MRFSEFGIKEDYSQSGNYQLPVNLTTTDDVQDLQKVLSAFRYMEPAEITGSYDLPTQDAIKRAQSDLSLPPTGSPDPDFISRVNTALKASPEINGIMAFLSTMVSKLFGNDEPVKTNTNAKTNNPVKPVGMYTSDPYNNQSYYNNQIDNLKRAFGQRHTQNYGYEPDSTQEPDANQGYEDPANVNDKVTPLRSYKGKLERGFIQKTEKIARELGIDPNILMKVMQHESGGTFSPSVPNGKHVGLIQFSKDTAARLGTSLAELSQMSQLQQLDYVKQYLINVGVQPGMDEAEIYMLIFLPWSKNKSDNVVIGRDNDHSPLKGTQISKDSLWKSNPAFARFAQRKGQDYYTKGDVIDYFRTYKPT